MGCCRAFMLIINKGRKLDSVMSSGPAVVY